MDIFDSEYYKIYKKLHRCLGSWPYQKPIEKYRNRFIVFFVMVSTLIPGLIYLFAARNEIEMMINCLPIILTYFIHIAKYNNHVFNEDKMTILFDMMKDNWQILNAEQKRVIMHEYAKTGRKLSILVLVTYYTIILLYMLLPFTPIVLDILDPLNESRPLIFIFETDYLIDREKYYFPITIHHYIAALFCAAVITVTDGTYGLYTQHACGLFAIAKYQLENMTFQKNHKNGILSNERANINQIILGVNKHRNAIQFSDAMESAHNDLLLFIMGLGLGCVSVLGVQMLLNFDKPYEVLRYSMMCIAHLLHIFYYSWNGQSITNHSEMVHDAAYNSEWETFLGKATQHLILVILRSGKPCEQTAGKLFSMNLMNFTMIMKTAMSYFTVLSNFQ